MITLKQITEACEYRICGGDDYLWNCYGPNARHLDFNDRDGTECVGIIFDTKTQVVYEIGVSVPGYDQAFGWHNPDYLEAYIKECEAHNIEPYQAWDDVYYQQMDADTLLQYVKDIVGTYYDNLPVPESL